MEVQILKNKLYWSFSNHTGIHTDTRLYNTAIAQLVMNFRLLMVSWKAPKTQAKFLNNLFDVFYMFLLFAVKNNTPKYFKIHLLTQVFTFRPQPYPFDPWRSQPSQKVFRQLNYSLQTVSNRSGSSLPDGLFMLQYFFRRFVRNWSGPSGKVTNTYSSLHTPTRNKNKAVLLGH